MPPCPDMVARPESAKQRASLPGVSCCNKGASSDDCCGISLIARGQFDQSTAAKSWPILYRRFGYPQPPCGCQERLSGDSSPRGHCHQNNKEHRAGLRLNLGFRTATSVPMVSWRSYLDPIARGRRIVPEFGNACSRLSIRSAVSGSPAKIR